MSLLDITAEEGVMIGDELTTQTFWARIRSACAIYGSITTLPRISVIVPSHEIASLRDIQKVIDSLG